MQFLRRSLTGLFLLALTLGLLGLGAAVLREAIQSRMRAGPERAARERVYTVAVMRAHVQTARPVIETYGEIRARRRLDIRAPMGGRIIELSPSFVEGGRVSEGEVLVRFDQADARGAVEVARANLSDARAELSQAQEAIGLARDDLEGARAQAALRDGAVARQKKLLARGVGTDAMVESAALAAAAARQMVLAKRQALAQARARLERARTNLKRRQFALDDASRRLDDTVLRAGFDGVLSNVAAVEGGLVAPNERLARLIDAAALEVSFRLSTAQFSRLSRGDGQAGGAVWVLPDGQAGAARRVRGRIERVGAEVGKGQTGRQLFAGLPDALGAGLRPGDFVSVEVAEPVIENAIILPATALDAQGRVLVVGKDDRLREQAVTLLRRQGNDVILSAPALAGKLVVTRRSPLLGAGIRVRPLATNGPRRGGGGAAPGLGARAVRGATAGPESGPESRAGSGAGAGPGQGAMVRLSPERRASLIARVNASKLPPARRRQILDLLERERVPARMIARIESRQGG